MMEGSRVADASVAEGSSGVRSYKVLAGEDGNIREREDRYGRVRVSSRVRKVYVTVMFEGGVEVDRSAHEDRKKDAVAIGERWLKKGW